MGIEIERLEFEKRALSGEVPIPPEHARFFELAARGVSPREIALHGWSSGHAFSFRALVRFIAFLCEKRLIVNKSAYEFCEALRPGHSWRSTLISEPIFDLEILRWRPGRARPWLALGLAAPLLALGALGAIALLYLYGEVYHARPLGGGELTPFAGLGFGARFWGLLAAGYVWTSVARSFVGASKFVLTRLASGEAKSLRLAFDLVSLRLEASEASASQRKTAAEGAVAAASLLAAFGAPLLALAFAPGARAATAAALFSTVAVLIEFSPFVRGPFTDALRYLYNWRLDRAGPDDAASGEAEAMIATFHVAANVVWTLAAAAFFALPIVDVGRYARSWMHFTTLSEKASAGLFFGFFALVAIAFIDDLANAVAYGGDSDRLRIRRLWRMRPRRAQDRALREALDFKSRVALEQAPILRQLSAKQREDVIRCSSLVSFAKGELICRQGEHRRELFILLSGRAVVEARKSGGRRRSVMQLEAGSAFGEVGFFLGHARTADVVAVEPCVTLEVRRDATSAELDPARSTELRDRIRFLQALASASFLRDLPGEAHDALASLGTPRAFKAGQTIVREGAPGDECYFIVQGQATVAQDRVAIRKLGPGDVFGEIALLRLQASRTATVSADSDVLAMELKGARLWELMSANLLLAVEIERLALRRLEADRLVSQTSGSSPNRP